MTALTLIAAVMLAAAGGPEALSDGGATLEAWSLVAAPGPAGPKDIPADLAPVRDAVKDLPYRAPPAVVPGRPGRARRHCQGHHARHPPPCAAVANTQRQSGGSYDALIGQAARSVRGLGRRAI